MKEKSTLIWLRKVTEKYRSFVVLLTGFEIIVSGLDESVTNSSIYEVILETID